MRFACGIASFSTARRSPARSPDIRDKPVTLPPGRARLAATPDPNWISADRHDDGDGRRPASCGEHRRPGHDDHDVDLAVDQLLRESVETFAPAFRPPVVDDDVAPLGVA